MNWIKKTLRFGEKIKTIIKQRASKAEIANSDWTSCCKGPILKKDLEDNLWVCPSCSKHHRISPHQRFDIIFGKTKKFKACLQGLSYFCFFIPLPT